MNVSELLLESVLQERFGLVQFRPKQKEVIDCILEKKHTLALLPTGYGKSLCYQVPSQVLSGVTVVISPLIALMQDQVNGLMRRGISNATLINSSISFDEQSRRIDAIRNGALKLVYVAPERFESPRFRDLLKSLEVSLLVIDEAHCISQWGHDFRPQYRNLSSLITQMPQSTVLALTATATPSVQRDIVQSLAIPQMRVITGSFDRPNLRLEVEACGDGKTKDRHLLRMLQEAPGPCIVYTSSRREAERLSVWLKQQRIGADCYHAGMSPGDRERTQKRFEQETVKAIVCTVAFGMGVDKSNICRVIHYNLPGSLEGYYQEAGRAGRDGNPAVCTLLYQAKDIYTQRWLMDRNYPSAQEVAQIFNCIRGRVGDPIRAAEIIQSTGVADAALNSTVDLLRTLQLIDTTHDGSYIDRSTAREPQIDMTLMHQRRQRDSLRLERMIAYAQAAKCRRAQILDYFGQRLEGACSGCDICSPLKSRILRAAADAVEQASAAVSSLHRDVRVKQVDHAVVTGGIDAGGSVSHKVIALTAELRGKVGRTTIAQILVGSKAKKIKEKGFDKLELYSSCLRLKEDDVLAIVDELISKGQLRVIPGMYPKVVVTEAGIAALIPAKR